jgi:hypothetical protein
MVQTAGVLGTHWTELVPGQLKNFQLLYFRSRMVPMRLRIGAAPATLLGSGASWPVLFAGGETFTPVVDGVAVPVTFTAGSRSAQQVATLINQAAVGAGLMALPASVDATGQLRLTGSATGEQGLLTVTTALAAIGFASTAARDVGAGTDLDVNGLCLLQFEEQTAPTRIQVSGVGWVEFLAAGAAI